MADRAEVRVPDIGDFDAVEIIELLVKPGDQVEPEDPLITLESDKATMDVPAPLAGTVETMAVSLGDRVSEGDLILVLAVDDLSEPDRRPAEELTVRQPRPALEPATSEFRVVVPDLGDFTDVDVIEVLVAVGDTVDPEQGLITLETDKATMEVPAPKAGSVTELLIAVGDKVSGGDPVLVLKTAAADESVEAAPAADAPMPAAARPAPAAASGPAPLAQSAPLAPPTLPAIDEAGFGRAHASPSVRKLARELGVDLIRVRGSGVKNRITGDDVKSYVKSVLQGDGAGFGAGLPSMPRVDFAKFGPVEVRPLSRIQKISGPRLHASWVNLPHVTQHDEADVTDVEATRKALKSKAVERGIKLTPLAFVVRACVLTLQEFPQFSSSLSPDGESLVFKDYCHVGFAADTPNGLVVPVIRDADKKDIYELAEALGDLSAAAREGQLKAADMQGGVFTISSLGGIGGTAFTPIINAPEVAILGVSKIKTSPVYIDGAFVPRLMMPLSLSYDHRVIDGAAGVRFTSYLAQTLTDVDRLIEAIP